MAEDKPAGTGTPPRRRRRRRRRWLRLVLWLLVGAVVALGLLAAVLPFVFSDERIRDIVRRRAEAALGREVAIDFLDVDVTRGITLRGLRIANREGFGPEDLLRVGEADIEVRVWPLLTSFGRELHARVRVMGPRALIERNTAGMLNIADLLEPGAEGEPLVFDELSLELEVSDGSVVLRDHSEEGMRETALRDLEASAHLPAVDEALTYSIRATAEKGELDVRGSPRLFHEGVVRPDRVQGDLLALQASDFPVDVLIATLGGPDAVRSATGGLLATAEEPGQIEVNGRLSGETSVEGLPYGIGVIVRADLETLDASAEVGLDAGDFSRASLDLNVKRGGAEGFFAKLDLDADLAKLTGGPAAPGLGIPRDPDGGPATSKGHVTARLEISGKAQALGVRIRCSVKGFQAHPSLTGGSTLPPEDATLEARSVLRLTPEGILAALEIPELKAAAGFLDASITNGRLASLADLRRLTADLEGRMHFDGAEFGSRFGKALGLPVIRDSLTLVFSAKGDEGRARLSAEARLESPDQPEHGVRIVASALLDATGDTADAHGLNVTVTTGSAETPSAHVRLTGAIADLTGAPAAALRLDAEAELGKLRPTLLARGLLPEDLDLSGRARLVGALDTAAGRADIEALEVRLPYLELALKEPCRISGLHLGRLFADPAAGARSLSANAVLEGTVVLDALDGLPEGWAPAELQGEGDVRFTLRASQASPAQFVLSADATAAGIEYGDLLAKPRGSQATLRLEADLKETGGADVKELTLSLDGADGALAGRFDEDFDTFTCRRFALKADRLSQVAALVPLLRPFGLGGAAEIAGSGAVPLRELASGDLTGLELEATAELASLHLAPEALGDLTLEVRGRVAAMPRSVQANGLTITARTPQGRRGQTVTFEKLTIAPADAGTLFAHLDALEVAFAASSPEIDLSRLLAALPKGAPDAPEAARPDKPDPDRFAFLKRHRVEGRVAADKLAFEEHVLTDLAARFRLADNTLTVPEPIRARVHGGDAEIALEADFNDPAIAHHGAVQVKEADLNSIAAALLSLEDVFLGKLDGNATWKGKGLAFADISKSWTGDIAFTVDEGVVLNFERSPLLKGIAGPILKHLGAEAFPDGRYGYERLNIEAHLEEGRIHADDAVLHGTNDLDFAITGSSVGLDGDLDAKLAVMAPMELVMEYVERKIVRHEAALKVVRKALEEKRPAFCTFTVRGHHDTPKIGLDLTSFPKWVLGLVGETLRDPRGLIEGILDEALDEEEDGEMDPKDKIKKKVLEDVLDGIFR